MVCIDIIEGDEDHLRGPTVFRQRQAGDDIEAIVTEITMQNGEKETASTFRMLDCSVLDMLLSRDTINGEQYHAGSRFYSDWYFSGQANSGVIDTTKEYVDGKTFDAESDRRLDAMTRFKRAVQKVGQVHARPLCAILLSGVRLEDYGRNRYHYNHPK